MSRNKKLVRNLLILTVMILLFFRFSNLYLTPLSAHEHSERSIHYGPSKVVHIEDFEKGKYILCKYDRWISCNTVKQQFFLFWGFGNQVTGIENKKDQKLSYTLNMSYEYWKLYGIINDQAIKKVQIKLSNGQILTTTDFYEEMFLFTWKSQKTADLYSNENIYFTEIHGFDSDNKVIFEDKNQSGA